MAAIVGFVNAPHPTGAAPLNDDTRANFDARFEDRFFSKEGMTDLAQTTQPTFEV
jgi:hypothetical protein